MEMNYEIVTLAAKKVIGIETRTNNNAPDMGQIIGGLWQTFYQDGICQSITHRANDKSLGIYTDYAGKEMDDYTVMAACEVDAEATAAPGTVTRIVPAGKYARFVVTGDMQAVGSFWEKLWETDLPRTYLYDFEEYQNADPANAIVHVYIGLK